MTHRDVCCCCSSIQFCRTTVACTTSRQSISSWPRPVPPAVSVSRQPAVAPNSLHCTVHRALQVQFETAMAGTWPSQLLSGLAATWQVHKWSWCHACTARASQQHSLCKNACTYWPDGLFTSGLLQASRPDEVCYLRPEQRLLK